MKWLRDQIEMREASTCGPLSSMSCSLNSLKSVDCNSHDLSSFVAFVGGGGGREGGGEGGGKGEGEGGGGGGGGRGRGGRGGGEGGGRGGGEGELGGGGGGMRGRGEGLSNLHPQNRTLVLQTSLQKPYVRGAQSKLLRIK